MQVDNVSSSQSRGNIAYMSARKSTSAPRVIAITSGKGGVGKTHTSVNLGLSLVQQGYKVLILDADLSLANVNVLLGFTPSANIQDILSGKAEAKDVIVNHETGIDILPASSGISDLTLLEQSEKMALVSALDELANEYDFLIVDTGAGIGSNVMYFNVAAEEIIVVIDPEPTTITDAYAAIKVLSTEHGRKHFSIIVNRLPKSKDGRKSYAKLAAATDKFLNVGMRYLGSIAEDEAVTEAVLAQTPYLELYPSSKASRDVVHIAKKIQSEKYGQSSSGGLQFFYQALL